MDDIEIKNGWKVWGDKSISFPELSEEEAKEMCVYIKTLLTLPMGSVINL